MKTSRPLRCGNHLALCACVIGISWLVGRTSALADPPVQILPGQGVDFVQVDFIHPPELVVSNSDTGQLIVDPAAVAAYSGKASGYLNVGTIDGWVAYNVPIVSDFPYAGICAAFKLPVPSGTPLNTLGACVVITDGPLTNFTSGPFDYWSVGKSAYNVGGILSDPPSGQLFPPAVNFVVTNSFTNSWNKIVWIVSQPRHPIVQSAFDQCWPCAVANSLQWLENIYRIPVPDDNIPGFWYSLQDKFVPQNSLPAHLDKAMKRSGASTRRDGNATFDANVVPGKLGYMGGSALVPNPGLSGLVTRHQALVLGVTNDFTTNGLTSTWMGYPDFDFILTNLMNGADVELSYQCFSCNNWPGTGANQGHAVEVVAAGYNQAHQPYVMFASDTIETPDDTNDIQGAIILYSLVTGPDNCGRYHLAGLTSECSDGPSIKMVIAEMPSPGMLNPAWSQLPGGRVYLDNTNAFGGDRASDFNWSSPQGQPSVADDFRFSARPITAVRWWGSYLNNHNPGDEDAYVLSFLTDVQSNTFSRPGVLCATYIAPLDKIRVTNTSLVGLDGKAIYEYCVNLREACLYIGNTNATAGPTVWTFDSSNGVYWLAIDAERGRTFTFTNGLWTNYASGKSVLAEHFWGWHTSPCSNLDVSVTGQLTTNLVSGRLTTNLYYQSWSSNALFYGELDQAFELLTLAPQPAVSVGMQAWLQQPDQTCSGVAVLATSGTGTPIVADDFVSTSNKPISCIYIWGAWLNDRYDSKASFRLRIYNDVPASNNVPSHPGTKLWEKLFTATPTNKYVVAGDYWSASLVASNLCESFWDPSQSAGMGNATRDSRLYQYKLYMPTNDQFLPTNRQTLWLSVTATGTTNQFAWKSAITNDHHMDDAAFSTQASPPSSGWIDLHYPTNHPFAGRTMDMAFALTTPLVASLSHSAGSMTISYMSEPPETVSVSGSSTWIVEVGSNGETVDADTNGLDQVATEMVQLALSGDSSLGPVTFRLRDQNQSPYLPSVGQIKETSNLVSNSLELPPYAESGYADSFFDVFFEIEVGGNVLHSPVPVSLGAVISSVPPPMSWEYYSSTGTIPLLDENEYSTDYSLLNVTYIPVGVPPPEFTEIRIISPGTLRISWEYGGELQASPSLRGPSWTTVGTSSPYLGSMPGTMQFYRLYRP